jgi:hypothetical protein
VYVFECGIIGIDLDEVGAVMVCDGPIVRGWILVVFLLLALRFCPANRVSGEAVRRGVKGLEAVGEPRVLDDSGDGDDTGSFKTSLRDVLGPVLATCQGEAALLPTFSTVIWG